MRARRFANGWDVGTLFWISAFTFVVVVSMVVGYVFGQQALSGVSSPVDPKAQANQSNESFRDPRTVPLSNEQDLIAQATRLLRQAPTRPTPGSDVTSRQDFGSNLSPEMRARIAAQLPPTPPTSVGPVTLQVLAVQRQSDDLAVTVALQNTSNEEVRFLYSFLTVTNDKQRPLRSSTQGLPEQLPADGMFYEGLVRIPLDDLGESKTISLSLTDYPSGQYRLVVTGVAVPES